MFVAKTRFINYQLSIINYFSSFFFICPDYNQKKQQSPFKSFVFCLIIIFVSGILSVWDLRLQVLAIYRQNLKACLIAKFTE